MARYPDASDPKTRQRFIKEGRGLGERGAFTPWILGHELSSRGKTHRVVGWKTGRTHHFLSDIEWNFFLAADWSPTVVDIREQFPLLPLSRTVDIAKNLNVRHPQNSKNKREYVMTTDFVLTMKDGSTIAVSIKPSQELSKKSVWEKFEIERLYWSERGITCDMATEKQLCLPLSRNIEWLHKFRDLTGHRIDEARAVQIGDHLLPSVIEGKQPLAFLALDLDETLGFEHGTCLLAVKHLIASRRWIVDLTKKLDPSQPLKLLRSHQASDSAASHLSVAA